MEEIGSGVEARHAETSPFTVDGRRLEVVRIAGDRSRRSIVLLHEGLGSLEMWRDFPQRLALATGREVIVYSRYGHGRSERLAQPRAVAYMHDEARIVLPQLLTALDVRAPVLFGHSDGASVALIYAATEPRNVSALVLEAPHVFVEALTLQSIRAAREAARTGDLLARLSRYHDDATATFRGWNDIWLHPDFARWDITALLPAVRVPILMLQGRDDEYGTTAQLTAIAAAVEGTATVLLDACGHSPHRAQPQAVLEHVQSFLEPIP